MKWTFAFLVLAAPAFAETCPAAPDHSEQQAALIAQLQALPNPVRSTELNNALWELWTDAPDETAQALLDEGMRKRSGFDLLGARAEFDQLVEYCPDYAEGYNQRAFANFLDANYEGAIFDLDIALSLNENHTGALTGKALSLLRLGRNEEAQIYLRAAVAVNPWLAERSLLDEPEGEDI